MKIMTLERKSETSQVVTRPQNSIFDQTFNNSMCLKNKTRQGEFVIL